MLSFLVKLPRTQKRIIILSIDFILILLSFFGSFGIRLDNSNAFHSIHHWIIALVLSIVTLFVFFKLGIYKSVLRFITIKISYPIIIGTAISTLSMLLLSFLSQLIVPRAVLFLYFLFLAITTIGVRLFFRILLTWENNKKNIKVLIYGAGESGRQLLTALNQVSGYTICAFIDDNKNLHKLSIHGIKVYSPKNLEKLVNEYKIEKILLAIPSETVNRRREIIQSLSSFPCEILSVPGIEDIVTGKAQLTTLNKVSADELLGREPVKPLPELLKSNIENKVVLVTGAGGSIGSELCRQIINQKPKLLILFEISEYSLYKIESELKVQISQNNLDITLLPIIGTIQNKAHLLKIMETFSVETIYHAAAYKHVPMVEYNVVEGVKNNVLGTLNTAQAAIEAKVDTFVLISTDKAVRPTNTMGATKRLAELILQALAKQQFGTRFCMVRFGNVLGSSGSVIPLFRKQIEQGGPITLTHPEITRYFMTIPEASQLVIQAGAMGKGGDVFVLDMGESVKIIDLARRMIQLMGLTEKNKANSSGDIEIKITGLRPGEKLYEELLIGDNVQKTSHPRIMTAKEVMWDWDRLNELLRSISKACEIYDVEMVRELLLQAPTAFNPVDEICDVIWKEHNC